MHVSTRLGHLAYDEAMDPANMNLIKPDEACDTERAFT
jgi:hypothetical protein